MLQKLFTSTEQGSVLIAIRVQPGHICLCLRLSDMQIQAKKSMLKEIWVHQCTWLGKSGNLATKITYCHFRKRANWFTSCPRDDNSEVEMQYCNKTEGFFVMTGNINIWSPPRVHPKALLIIYFHDCPPTIYNLSEPTICDDYTSAIICTKHFDHYCHKSVSNEKWFAVKNVDLN